jgi:hypothetical protein
VALRRLLAEGVATDGGGRHGIGPALHRVGRLARQTGFVVVVSDFRGPREDWRRPLRLLAGRHHVLAVEVRDPREMELPPAGRLALVDPETGRRVEVDTSRRGLRERFAAAAAAERAEVADDIRRSRAQHVVLSTQGNWLRDLGRKLR